MAQAYADGMAEYLDEDAARADGYTIEHHPERREFALVNGGEVRGVAHYSLYGGGGESTDDGAIIDFDHTFVSPQWRGTGLSEVLARHALTDEIVRGRHIHASCSFIAAYLRRHPELRSGA